MVQYKAVIALTPVAQVQYTRLFRHTTFRTSSNNTWDTHSSMAQEDRWPILGHIPHMFITIMDNPIILRWELDQLLAIRLTSRCNILTHNKGNICAQVQRQVNILFQCLGPTNADVYCSKQSGELCLECCWRSSINTTWPTTETEAVRACALGWQFTFWNCRQRLERPFLSRRDQRY